MTLNRVNAGNRGIGVSSNPGSSLYSKRIQAGLSTQIVIQVEDEATGTRYTIGAIQSLQITENRRIETIKEVGTDANVGIVPTEATSYEASLSRIIFDFQRLPQALQREYRHIHAQRRPFDIVITDYNPYIQGATGPIPGDDAGGGSTSVSDQGAIGAEDTTRFSTRLKNCWFNRLSVNYQTSSFLITEDASITFQAIFDEGAEASTVAPAKDSLERKTNMTGGASIMSAANATRTP